MTKTKKKIHVSVFVHECLFWWAELYDRIEILDTGLPNFSVQSEKAVKHIKRPCEKSQIWLIFSPNWHYTKSFVVTTYFRNFELPEIW